MMWWETSERGRCGWLVCGTLERCDAWSRAAVYDQCFRRCCTAGRSTSLDVKTAVVDLQSCFICTIISTSCREFYGVVGTNLVILSSSTIEEQCTASQYPSSMLNTIGGDLAPSSF